MKKKIILAIGIIALFVGMTFVPMGASLSTNVLEDREETMEQATTDYDGGWIFSVAYVSGDVRVSQFSNDARRYNIWANEEITIFGIGIKQDGSWIWDVIPLPRVAHISAGTRFSADVPFPRLNGLKEGTQDISRILLSLVTQ